MKRIGGLYEQICSLENLRLADEKARKHKAHSYGVFKIYEPKERLIFRLLWVSVFTSDTYSCIKNLGIHAAAKRLKRELKLDPEGTKYCLKIDVRKFYPSIDHDILKQVVRRKIKDKRLLWLLDEIIDSADGVPIGNYLSQYFANLYLAYFDHWIKEEKGVKYYYRYADDIVILGSDKEKLQSLLHEMRAYLRDRLKLKIKRNYQVFPVDSRGIDFLGYRFFHTHTLLRKSIKRKFCRRVAMLRKKKYVKYKHFKQQICSWWGWCKHCDSVNLVNNILKKVPYEIKF